MSFLLVQSDCRIFWSSISLKGMCISDFLHGENCQGQVASETNFWLDVARCASCQSDCWVLWSRISLEKINILFFYTWRWCHQGKVGFETTAFVWMWIGVPHVQSACTILCSAISLEGSKWFIDFLYGYIHQEKVAYDTNTFGCMTSGGPLVLSVSRVLWSSTFLQ